MKRPVVFAAFVLAALGCSRFALAVTYFWDPNTTTSSPAFGTASGTWGTNAFWNTDSTGAFGGTTATNTGTSDAVNFGFGATGLAGGTVSVAGAGQGFNSMTFASGSGAITISGGTQLNLAASTNISVDNAVTNIISTPLVGAGAALTKLGSGTLTLNGLNTYTGGTTVSQGTLTLVGAGGPAGTIRGALAIGSGVTVNADTNWSLGWGGAAVGVSTISLTGGTLNFTGADNLAGTQASSMTLTGGTISGTTFAWFNGITSNPTLSTLASSTTSTISSGIRLRLGVAGNSLTFNVASGSAPGGVDLLVSGPIALGAISDAHGGIIKSGAGLMQLTGTNTYDGFTQVFAGTLEIGGAGTLGGGAYGNSIRIDAPGTFKYNSSANQTLSGVVWGTGTLDKSGSGTLTLNAAFNATFNLTGAVAVNEGILQLAGPINTAESMLSKTSGITINNGGTLLVSEWNALHGYSSTGVSTLTINTGGMMTTSNGVTAHIRGPLTLNGGTLASGTPDVTNGSWNIDNSVLVSDNSTISATGVTGINGTTTITVNPGTTLNVTGNFRDVSGGGSSAFTLTGGGTMNFGGANTYTGLTSINAGTLLVNGSIAGPADINNGGTLGGIGTIGGFTTLRSGGTVSPGNSVGTLFTDDFNWQGGGTYDWEVTNLSGMPGTGWDLLNLSGNLLTFTGGGPFIVDIDATAVPFDYQNHVFEIARTGGAGDVLGFSAANFTLNATGPAAYQWSIFEQNNSVFLQATATPEPTALLGWSVVGLVAAVAFGWRCRSPRLQLDARRS